MITLVMAKSGIGNLKKSGSIGYTEPFTASFDVPEDGNIIADATLMNMGFKWFSSITPTKEEFLSGEMIASYGGEHIMTLPIGMDSAVVAEATGAYCVQMGTVYFVVTTVTENELGHLPKIGMYYATEYFATDKTQWGLQITLDFGETIHPIDPKYLPGVCLPVVEITSANYPSDGEAVYLTEDESAMLNSAVTKSNTIIVKIKDVFNGFPVMLPFVMDVTAAVTEGTSVLILVDNTKKISMFRANDEWIMGG